MIRHLAANLGLAPNSETRIRAAAPTLSARCHRCGVDSAIDQHRLCLMPLRWALGLALREVGMPVLGERLDSRFVSSPRDKLGFTSVLAKAAHECRLNGHDRLADALTAYARCILRRVESWSLGTKTSYGRREIRWARLMLAQHARGER